MTIRWPGVHSARGDIPGEDLLLAQEASFNPILTLNDPRQGEGLNSGGGVVSAIVQVDLNSGGGVVVAIVQVVTRHRLHIGFNATHHSHHARLNQQPKVLRQVWWTGNQQSKALRQVWRAGNQQPKVLPLLH